MISSFTRSTWLALSRRSPTLHLFANVQIIHFQEFSQSTNTRWTHPIVVMLGPPKVGRTRLAQAILGEPYDTRFSHPSGLTMTNVCMHASLDGAATIWGKAASMHSSPLNDYLNDKADGVPEEVVMPASNQPSRVRMGLAAVARGVKSIFKLIRRDVDPTPSERLKFQLWDFSSAALEANAHRVFLNMARLAVVTVNARHFVTRLVSKRLQAARQLRFWLNDLVCFSPAVNVIIVATHAQGLTVEQATTLDTGLRQVIAEFTPLLAFVTDRPQSRPWFAVNGLNGQGVQAVKEAIQGFVKDAAPEPLPLSWLVLLQHLLTAHGETHKAVSLANVAALARDYNVLEREEVQAMLDQFAASGYVWCASEELILDTHWLYREITKLTAERRATIATLESNALLSELSRGFATKDVLLALWQHSELIEFAMRKFYLLTPWHQLQGSVHGDHKYIVHANLTKPPYGTRKQDPTVRATITLSVQPTLTLPHGVTERFIAMCAQAIISCGPGALLKSSFARNYSFLSFDAAQQGKQPIHGQCPINSSYLTSSAHALQRPRR